MEPINSFEREGNTIKVSLQVMFYEEGDYFVAYCPALELSSYGETNKTAKSAFENALTIFLEETMSRGTLEKELLSLGWVLQKVPEAKYKPPSLNIKELMAAKLRPSLITERISIPV